jgi:NAD(P)-dependent dehydrogenase (short-subunit alcohol dehydrogenase family)
MRPSQCPCLIAGAASALRWAFAQTLHARGANRRLCTKCVFAIRSVFFRAAVVAGHVDGQERCNRMLDL